MTDDIFNTLAAVMIMCGSHHHLVGHDMAYEAGFEKCSVINAAYEAEMHRRLAEERKEIARHDKDRIENVLNALEGKAFHPEPPPAPLFIQSGCMSAPLYATPLVNH